MQIYLFLGFLQALLQTFCYTDVEPVWNQTFFLQISCLAAEISPNVFVLQQVSVLLWVLITLCGEGSREWKIFIVNIKALVYYKKLNKKHN